MCGTRGVPGRHVGRCVAHRRRHAPEHALVTVGQPVRDLTWRHKSAPSVSESNAVTCLFHSALPPAVFDVCRRASSLHCPLPPAVSDVPRSAPSFHSLLQCTTFAVAGVGLVLSFSCMAISDHMGILGTPFYLGVWSAFGECGTTCGKSTKERTRECLGNCGPTCTDSLSDTQSCSIGTINFISD